MTNKHTTYNADELPLVAIDLGSSCIRAIAAERRGENSLRILGYEQNTRYNCVKNGVVSQIEDASYQIRETLRLLANRIGVKELPSAFALIGGKSLQIVPVPCKRDLLREQPITSTILDALKKECYEKIERNNPQAAVLELMPSFFLLDGKTMTDYPTSAQRATMIEANFIAFVGYKELLNNVENSYSLAKCTIEQRFIRPDAQLSAFMSENPDVMKEGCAVLDLGAQTTTLSIYKGNQFLATKTIPMGGDDITAAISKMQITLETAELIKCKYGCASADMVDTDYQFKVSSASGDGSQLVVTCKQVSRVIEQCLNQILTPQLDLLNQYKERIKTIFITGGGSLLQGLPEWIQDRTPIEVTYGSHAALLDADTPDKFYSPIFSSLVGALIMGSDYRSEHPGNIINPNKKNKKKPTFTYLLIDILTEQSK